jgi:ABC-type oligopeptide transport system substrate-binding subunit
MAFFPRIILASTMAGTLASCSFGADSGTIEVAFIGTPEAMFTEGIRLSAPAQQIRAATAQGLVRLDEHGEVVPGLAERWIVTDDGMSYIFRLQNMNWPDGSPLTSQSVRDRLVRMQRDLRGTSLGLDLEQVSEIRAMTGRVVEFRLASPMPDFLQLLAQPELGLLRNDSGTGPMALAREENAALLTALPPEMRGQPELPGWEDKIRVVRVRAMPATAATDAFDDGAVDLVLNGQIQNLPLADVGPLSRGTVRLDAALGLFGLDVRSEGEGFLSEAARREAIAMAIDRRALLEPFNIGGWVATTRVVAPRLASDTGTIGERWAGSTIAARRAEAARRVSAYAGTTGEEVTLKLGLPGGPGSDILFEGLAAQLGAIGIRLERVGLDEPADLALIDRLARYGSARWFLNQFNCSLRRGLCSADADALVADAVQARDPAQQADLLAEAEAELTRENVYIPIGAPIRWSLARGDVSGFTENRWSLHPLFPLSRAPI